jgi:2-dehydropantoate 2-reductase
MTPPTFKNICIYGAGALGGAIATKLAVHLGDRATVSVVARGAHLDSIRRDGIRLFEAGSDQPITCKLTATADPGELPAQDLIITGLKGHQLSAAAQGIAGLTKEGTRVMMILNGIPWWYFHRDEKSGFAERQFPELDPDGKLWRLVGPERVIGCVAQQGAEVAKPGEIRLSNKGRFLLGEPSGEISADLEAIVALISDSGITATATSLIRDEIWSKLMGNAAFNPISALTGARMNDIMADPSLAALVAKVMQEVKAVGQSLGTTFEISIDDRIAQSRKIGPVRTSMLQDLLAGKPLELVPLVGMVVALGQLTKVPVPATETVFALAAQRDRENFRSQQ